MLFIIIIIYLVSFLFFGAIHLGYIDETNTDLNKCFYFFWIVYFVIFKYSLIYKWIYNWFFKYYSNYFFIYDYIYYKLKFKFKYIYYNLIKKLKNLINLNKKYKRV